MIDEIVCLEECINGSNVKLGTNALKKNQNGKNVALGHKSLENNVDGFQNTSVGAYSLGRNQTSEAINNTALGFKSIQNNLSGKYNTAVGALSGKTLQTGSKNVLLGKHTDVSSIDALNQIVIGQGAVGLSDNSVTLGNDNIENAYMSSKNNALIHCGGLNIYNEKNNLSYKLPNTDGENNQVLKTDGKGNVYWKNELTGGGSSGGSTTTNSNTVVKATNVPPTNSDRSGNAGDLRYDDNYLYLCLGNNNWERITLSSALTFNWSKLGDDIDGEAENEFSGTSVSLSSDGTRVAIGAQFNDGTNGIQSGHVRIYEYS